MLGVHWKVIHSYLFGKLLEKLIFAAIVNSKQLFSQIVIVDNNRCLTKTLIGALLVENWYVGCIFVLSSFGITYLVLTQNFPKNYHFLPLFTRTYVCVSWGKKFFSESFA